jgi:hypothetical protein
MFGKIWKVVIDSHKFNSATQLVTSDGLSTPVLVVDMSTFPSSTELRAMLQASKQFSYQNNLNSLHKVFPNLFD